MLCRTLIPLIIERTLFHRRSDLDLLFGQNGLAIGASLACLKVRSVNIPKPKPANTPPSASKPLTPIEQMFEPLDPNDPVIQYLRNGPIDETFTGF